MINYLIFDGRSSRDYGLYISGSGAFNAPERDVERVEIAGRSGDLILRLYEDQNRSCTTEVKLNLPVRRAWLCDMLENKLRPVEIRGNRIRLDFAAFKVLTLRLKMESAPTKTHPAPPA